MLQTLGKVKKTIKHGFEDYWHNFNDLIELVLNTVASPSLSLYNCINFIPLPNTDNIVLVLLTKEKRLTNRLIIIGRTCCQFKIKHIQGGRIVWTSREMLFFLFVPIIFWGLLLLVVASKIEIISVKIYVFLLKFK